MTTSGRVLAQRMAREAGAAAPARSAGIPGEAPRAMIVDTATTTGHAAAVTSGSRSSCYSPRNQCTATS